MGLYSNFPYTNFHEMNLDWILKELKELVSEWESFGVNVTSEAHVSSTPEVTVTGDLKTGLNFDFGIVEGPRGQTGPEGPRGPEGPEGKGLEILGVYATLSQLQTAHPTGTAGDIYLVGSDNNFIMYVWSEDQNAWLEGGALTSPSPSATAPLMNGIASSGSSTAYSRGDHVHPSDTSKQDLLVSGTNIKTVNGYSILGSGDVALKTVNNQAITGQGDITVQEPLVSGTNIKTVNSNSVLGSGDIEVQEPLVSGTNIKTVNSNSLLGAGDLAVQETLVSGTNIKTINGQSILGAGDIEVSGSLSSFVGMVVQGTNLTTEANVKTLYGNSTSWQLLSSVILASENVFGNGIALGLTNGTKFVSVGGQSVSSQAILSNATNGYGTNVGAGISTGNGITTQNSVGVPTKTQLETNPENSGLIADTITVYTWERTA